MRRLFFFAFFSLSLTAARGQISISSDSLIMDKWDIDKAQNIPVKRIKENMLLVIDKDLLTLRVLGETEERSLIEQGFIIDLLEVSKDMNKWLFQGIDKNCTPYSITVDLSAKKISFINFGKSGGIERPIITIYYPILKFSINKEAIEKHLQEKGESNRLQ